MSGRVARAVAGAAVVAVAIGFIALGAPAHADGPAGVLSGQLDSFAVRVEYDTGEARRSPGAESSKGLAAAPTEIGAVVAGKYVDPNGTGHAQRALPQAECFFPGALLDTHFLFPTDTQAGTKPLPALAYSTARCGAGPEVELHAHDVGSDTAGLPTAGISAVTVAGSVVSDALTRPVKDVLDSRTSSSASDVSILGGAMKIGSIVAEGHSSTTGKAKGAASEARVAVSNIGVSGLTFSMASAVRDGKQEAQFIVAGNTIPADSSAGVALVDSVNAALKPEGCTMSVLTTPASYPQGFLFSRPEPQLGVAPDGTLAASQRGGLLVVCDIPRSVSDQINGFSPERAQIVIGFAFTSTQVSTAVGGFSLGDLGGPVPGGTGVAGLNTSGGSLPSLDLGLPGAAPVVDALTAPVTGTAPARTSSAAAAIVPVHLSTAAKWLLAVLGLVVWALLTHIGARQFRAATSRAR
jgi:hypothetical protein